MIKFITIVLFMCLSITASADSITDALDKDFVKSTLKDWIIKTYPKNVSYLTASKIANAVYNQSEANEIEFEMIVGIISTESSFNTKAISKEGATGLMQVIPKYHRVKIKGRSLFEPEVAIEVGTAVYKDCLNKYSLNNKKALSCYSGSSGGTANKYYSTVMNKVNKFKDHLIMAMLTDQIAYLGNVNYLHYYVGMS